MRTKIGPPDQDSIEQAVLSAVTKTDTTRIVFTIMGPNGSGKSKLLRHIATSTNMRGIARMLVPSVRNLPTQLPDNPLNDGTRDITGLQKLALKSIMQPSVHMIGRKPYTTYEIALYQILQILIRNDQQIAERHLVALATWYKEKQENPGLPVPDPEEASVPKIARILTSVLGYDCSIEAGGSNPEVAANFRFEKDGSVFSQGELSDGEKQILISVLFLLRQDEQRILLLIDEPELHLNERRAIELWERVEANFPNAVFIYATHSVVFATRPTIDRLFILRNQEEAEEAASDEPLSDWAIREIVGARIQLLRSDLPPVFCEDELLADLMRELLCDVGCAVIPLTGWESVRNAVSDGKGWEGLRSGKLKSCGVIDRDVRADDEIETFRNKGVFALPYYEAESILLDPDLVLWAISIYKGGQGFDPARYDAIIAEQASKFLQITLNLLQEHLISSKRGKIRFDLSGNVISNVRFDAPSGIKEEFEARADAYVKAISGSDSRLILRLFKGKKMYPSVIEALSREANCSINSDPAQFFWELRVRGGFSAKFADLDCLKDLKSQIQQRLASPNV